MDNRSTQKILEKYNGERGELIAILEEIQNIHGYLPADELRIVSENMKCSLVDIYGVATFYKAFRLKPIGKHLISVCLGTACHVRGAPKVVEEFERQLGIYSGETTSDKKFTLETVNCLGACALGPIVVVDGHYFSNVTPIKVKKILEKACNDLERIDAVADRRIFPIEVSCPYCNHSLMDPDYFIEGLPSIKEIITSGERQGWLRLSCLYGSYTRESEYNIPEGTVVEFFCPYCDAKHTDSVKCAVCNAPLALVIVKGGGTLQICSRNGCRNHMLDLNGVGTDWTKTASRTKLVETR